MWLSTQIPAAIATVSSFWTDTLLPAVRRVWSFIDGSLMPLFRALVNFIKAVLGFELRVLAGIWQNIIAPALNKVWNIIKENIMPIFAVLVGYIKGTLQPILNTLGSFLKNTLVVAFKGIADAIKSVVDWLEKMAEKLNSLELPSFLVAHSPTPFEVGLVGIAKALEAVNQQLPDMAHGLQLNASGVPGAGGQTDNFAFFAPIIIQGSTPAGSLGARLKARRY
jgi:hypothetical protein